MNIAMQEMHAIASEIYLALGDQYHVDAYAIASARDWWTKLREPQSPTDFTCPHSYFKSAVASSLFKKYPDFPGDKELQEAAAWADWQKAEKQCFRANTRFFDYLSSGPLYQELPEGITKFLDDVKSEVREIMGPVPNDLNSHFGSGTTYDLRGNIQSSIPCKIGSIPSMTADAWPFLTAWSKTTWARYLAGDAFPDALEKDVLWTKCGIPATRFSGLQVELNVVRGNRWDSVPKNREKRRSIGVEPSLNLFYQLGVGTALKGRLRKYGYLLIPEPGDLFTRPQIDSQEIHRELARVGSVTGHISTIDLSAASDTVSYWLVRFLLGHRWFGILEMLRSPCTKDRKGKWHHLEKFSSMGNGFTFELETIIFASVCRVILRQLGISPERCSVFGDDIIVPTCASNDIIAALRFLGFTTNATKTFTTGPFRESCGGDYFSGVDVRPPSISGEPSNPIDWISIHNQLYRLKGRVNDYHLDRALRVCVRNIPSRFRCYGPVRYGDAVLHSDPTKWDTKMHRFADSTPKRTKGSAVLAVRAVFAEPQSLPWERFDEVLAACSGVYGLPSTHVSLRGEARGFRTGWLPIG